MRCPSCDTELIVNGQERLETLDEHVMCATTIALKDRYVCPNTKCVLKPENHCWNEYGEYYYTATGCQPLDKTQFIDGLTCARGTVSRQCERELGDNEETKRIPITKGRLKGWIKVIEVQYKADQDGNILGRVRHVKWITPERIYYVSPWHMLKFSLGRMYHARKSGKQEYSKYLRDTIERSKWPDAEKWRKAVAVLAKLLLKCDPKAYGVA